MTAVLERLRPHPHRGDVIAAGAVPLALCAIVIDLRMTRWGVGGRFVVVALIAGLILTMGWLAPLERETPRAYHSVLLVAGLLPLIAALQLLAELLGADRPPGPGADAWTFGAEAGIAAAAARRANSAVCTLIAALFGAIAAEALIAWVFNPHGLGAFRAGLVVLTAGFAGGAVRLRDRRRRHAVQLVNAAGLVTVAIGLSYVLQSVAAAAVHRLGGDGAVSTVSGASFGWKLYLLAVGFGLVGYAAVDHEPGPGYLGVLVLLIFALLVSLPAPERGSLLGWPLFLLVLGGAGLAVGLRPRRPLPPPPVSGQPAEAATPVPLRPKRRP